MKLRIILNNRLRIKVNAEVGMKVKKDWCPADVIRKKKMSAIPIVSSTTAELDL